jgi:hypothetical protein
MKLLQTFRTDPSDTFVFDRAADPGEWAISGAFMFAHSDPTTLARKARAAFRGGFLGIRSFGWSTLARIVEANDEDRAAAVEQLAARLVEHCGAPDLPAARPAAEEEIAFAACLCDHPAGRLIAVSRRHERGVTHEAFRTLQTSDPLVPKSAFTFIAVADEETPSEPVGLLVPPARGHR